MMGARGRVDDRSPRNNKRLHRKDGRTDQRIVSNTGGQAGSQRVANDIGRHGTARLLTSQDAIVKALLPKADAESRTCDPAGLLFPRDETPQG